MFALKLIPSRVAANTVALMVLRNILLTGFAVSAFLLPVWVALLLMFFYLLSSLVYYIQLRRFILILLTWAEPCKEE